jgi:hypothetical protein
MVGCILIIAILKIIYPKRFDDFIKLPVSNNYFLAKGKSEELRHPFSILLFIIQLISISLFINLFFLEKGKANMILFLKILVLVFVFIIVKTSIEKMIGAIFSIEKVIDHYIYEKLSYRNFLSLLLIVTNLIFYFSVKPDLNILLILTGILFLVNMVILFYGYKKYRSLIFSNLFYF